MLSFEDPEETYKAYQRFMRKENYRKARQCLEKLLMYSNDIELLRTMVSINLYELKDAKEAKKWLPRLFFLSNYWDNYVDSALVEAELGNFSTAWEEWKKAQKLIKKSPDFNDSECINRIFRAEQFIRQKEYSAKYKKIESSHTRSNKNIKNNKHAFVKKDKKLVETSVPEIPAKEIISSYSVPSYNIITKFTMPKQEDIEAFSANKVFSLEEARLWIEYNYLKIQRGFDELLCLASTEGIEKYWYQIETVKRTLKYFHGRVLLCDEVGLGKTIEAGMLIKEYLLRNMVKTVLILTPAPLVSQWQEELSTKFALEFASSDDENIANDPENLWGQKLLVASLNLAKSSKNMPIVSRQFYDLVVVDEAHHLRNRKTLAWKLVNKIQKKFIFLLTATPVHNNLVELYNLITLLKPGLFKTEKIFKEQYVKKGSPRVPTNKEKLKELLRDVMIRNTRSVIDLKLPKRFATTLRLTPNKQEQEIYTQLKDYLRKNKMKNHLINMLLREAGSSPFALYKTLESMKTTRQLKNILAAIENCSDIAKGQAVIDILKKSPQEKIIIFAQYLKSIDYIATLLEKHDTSYTVFRGDLTNRAKNEAISKFRDEVRVLVSSESGGEGRNLQFCRTIVNFDLPWNPMRIEQRIGRLHRIGQTRDVFIFNLAVKNTIEEYIIEILDSKINMFEMVIGEIEPIMGHTSHEGDFEDIILDIWLSSSSDEEVEEKFSQLGAEILEAKKEYLNVKKLDEEIFGEDYEA